MIIPGAAAITVPVVWVVLGSAPAVVVPVGLLAGVILLLPFWLMREGLLFELGSPVPRGVVLAIDERGVRVGALFTRRSQLVAWPDVASLRVVSRFQGRENDEDEYSFFLEVSRKNPYNDYTVSLADITVSSITSAVDRFAPQGLVLKDERSPGSMGG
jgi:hypothetical protein